MAFSALAVAHSAAITKRQEPCDYMYSSHDKRQIVDCPPSSPSIPPEEDCFRAAFSNISITYAEEILNCYDEHFTIVIGSNAFCSCRPIMEDSAVACGFNLDTVCPVESPSEPQPSPTQAPPEATTMAPHPTVVPKPTVGTPSPSRCFDRSIDLQSCLISSTYTICHSAALFCSECKTLFQETVRACLPQDSAQLEVESVNDFCIAAAAEDEISATNPLSSTLPNPTQCLVTTHHVFSCLSTFDFFSGVDYWHHFCIMCRLKLEEQAHTCFGDVAENNIQFLDNSCENLIH